MTENKVEPWLRGTLTEYDAVRRQVLHALILAQEDATRWCAPLTDDQINARPHGVAPVAFHLRHIARSLDRLLTYMDGRLLDQTQLAALKTELLPQAPTAVIMEEFTTGLTQAIARITSLDPATYEQPRTVGRDHLPTTVGGLLVHCADHTQRHIGQAITTAQLR